MEVSQKERDNYETNDILRGKLGVSYLLVSKNLSKGKILRAFLIKMVSLSFE